MSIKKFILSLFASIVMAFAIPQTASAEVYCFSFEDEDCTYWAYVNTDSGYYYVRCCDKEDGEVLFSMDNNGVYADEW